MVMLRARMCELIAELVPGVDPNEMCLVGLCSLLDAMLNRPMKDALNQLPLSEVVRNALPGEKNPLRSLLDTVMAYEAGAWEAALTPTVVQGNAALQRVWERARMGA